MDKITDGLKHDGGKLRLSLVPAEAIEAIGAVMTHGAEKYGKDTYKQVEPERYRDALMRHVCKWLKDPHGKDEDSGLPHLWHIITNAAMRRFYASWTSQRKQVRSTARCKTCVPHSKISASV